MKTTERPIYKKHNSFVEIRNEQKEEYVSVLERISTLRVRKDLTNNLSESHREILQQVFTDLYSPEMEDGESVFSLSPNVIHEINTYSDDDLPKYLVHRYRYEMFPQKHIVDDYPPYLQIEPSSVCNYRCVFCFETDKTFTKKSNGFMGSMDIELFKSIIDQAEGNVEFLSLASRGEPLLAPVIIQMLEYTQGKFLNLKLNTNASLLDEEKCHAILSGGVKTVVFSADAASEPLYSQLRVNGKLSIVLSNIERFKNIRETQYRENKIITRVSGVKYSDDQDIEMMQNIWGNLVDQVAFVNYNPWENVYEQLSNDISEPCSDLWRRMFVWWDGKINPCDVDYKSTLSMGTVVEHSLSEIWKSIAYSKIRKAHINTERGTISPCNHCTVI